MRRFHASMALDRHGPKKRHHRTHKYREDGDDLLADHVPPPLPAHALLLRGSIQVPDRRQRTARVDAPCSEGVVVRPRAVIAVPVAQSLSRAAILIRWPLGQRGSA